MKAVGASWPGRFKPPRPFFSRHSPLFCSAVLPLLAFLLCLLAAPPASAQATSFWPELARLISPERGLSGIVSGPPLPIAGWDAPGAAADDVVGGSPLSEPLLWLDSSLPVIRFGHGGALIYRDRLKGSRGSEISGSRSDISVAVPLERDSWSLMWGSTRVNATTVLELSSHRGGLERITDQKHVWLGMKREGRSWSGLIAVGQLGATRGPGEVAAAFQLGLSANWKSAFWALREAGSDLYDIYYKDSSASVGAPMDRTAFGVRLSGTVAGWNLLFRAERSDLSGRGTGRPLHRLRPRTAPRVAEVRVDSPDDVWHAAAGAERSRHRADLESLGLRYGRFLLDDSRSWIRAGWSPAWRKGAWRFWTGLVKTVLDGEGELEFWPFTPTIVDLLGLRRRGTADATVHLAGIGGRNSLGVSPAVRLLVGADLHCIWSEGNLESWEPVLLGLGKQNILRDQLTIRSAQLMDVGMEMKLTIERGVELLGGFAQIVPLSVQHRIRPSAATPTEPGAPDSERRWGGLRWWISLHLTVDAFHR